MPLWENYPESKGHVANMGPTWVLSAPGGSHVGPMNLVIRVVKATPVHNDKDAVTQT